MNFKPPQDILAAAISGLQAEAQIGSGPIVQLTINLDNTVSGVIPDVPFGNQTLRLNYFTQFNSEQIRLASLSKPLDIRVDQANNFIIENNELNRQYDKDGDTYLNIDELKNGTNPVSDLSYIVSIVVTPVNTSIPLGSTQQLSATATYPDLSTGIVTDTATWSSSQEVVATVSELSGMKGLVSSVGPGATIISAMLAGVNGTVALTVTAASITEIAISPSNPSLVLGNTVQLTATALYSDQTSQDITSQVLWSSLSGSVASVDNAGGLLSSLQVGTSTIRAALNSTLVATTLVTVTPAVLQSIEILPASLVLALGNTGAFKANAVFSDNSTSEITPSVTWSITNTAIATINNFGQITTLTEGSTPINALYQGKLAAANLTVGPAQLTQLSISPNRNSVPLGLTYNVTATGSYTNGTTKNETAQVTWSTNSTNISVNTNGIVTGTLAGTYSLTAALNGITATAVATITAKEISSIAVTPGNTSVSLGERVTYVATATYTDETLADISNSVTWNSADANIALIDATGFTKNIVIGTTTITASHPGGISGNTQYTALGDKVRNRVYLLAADLVVLDALDDTVLTTVTIPPSGVGGIALYPPNDPLWAFIAHSGTDTVSRLSLLTHKITNTYTVGNGPATVLAFENSFNPTIKRVFVINVNSGGMGSMSVIDTVTNRVIQTIALGEWPADADVGAGTVMIANYASPRNGRLGSIVKYNVDTGALTTLNSPSTCPKAIEYRRRTGRFIVVDDCSPGASTTSLTNYYNYFPGISTTEGPFSLGRSGSHTAMTVNREGLQTFVWHRSKTLNVTEYVTNTVTDKLTLPWWGLELKYNHFVNKLYAASWFETLPKLNIYDANYNLIKSIEIAGSIYEHGIAYTP